MNSVYIIISGGTPFGTAPTHQADGRIFFVGCIHFHRLYAIS